MFGVLRLFKVLSIPKSTPDEYHFDPQFMGSGSRVFNPNKTQGRFSEEDFNLLRVQMIFAGKSELNQAKCLLYTMFVIFPVSFLVFIAKIALEEFTTVVFPPYATYICIGIILGPNIILGCIWNSYSQKAHSALQEFLNQKNPGYLSTKKVTFEMAPSLKYMTIKFHNTSGIKMNPEWPRELKNMSTSRLL